MTGILAIETATEVCSVALYLDGDITDRHELAPREHSRRLFGMLEELLPGGDLRRAGVDAIAYGCGPGSFTGLRICASAVQGLAYTSALPAIPISTLACQAQTALREGVVAEDATVLSTLDARINEVYYAVYRFDEGLPKLHCGPLAGAPGRIKPFDDIVTLQAVGSGARLIEQFPATVRARLGSVYPDLLPAARDLLPLALVSLAQGQTQSPSEVQPVYVRDEISWKKLAEQGKSA
jgi:tRNA threonylcarbamoyladenosine biosynthesis protein TsaB